MENEEISVWWGPEKGKVTQAAEYVGVANSVPGNNVALQISYQDSEVEIIDAHSLSFIDSRSEEGGDIGIQSHEGKRLAWIAAAHKNEHVLAKLDSMFSSSINFTCQAEKEKRKRSSPSEQGASRRRRTKAPVNFEKDNLASASDTVRRKIALGDVREPHIRGMCHNLHIEHNKFVRTTNRQLTLTQVKHLHRAYELNWALLQKK